MCVAPLGRSTRLAAAQRELEAGDAQRVTQARVELDVGTARHADLGVEVVPALVCDHVVERPVRTVTSSRRTTGEASRQPGAPLGVEELHADEGRRQHHDTRSTLGDARDRTSIQQLAAVVERQRVDSRRGATEARPDRERGVEGGRDRLGHHLGLARHARAQAQPAGRGGAEVVSAREPATPFDPGRRQQRVDLRDQRVEIVGAHGTDGLPGAQQSDARERSP